MRPFAAPIGLLAACVAVAFTLPAYAVDLTTVAYHLGVPGDVVVGWLLPAFFSWVPYALMGGGLVACEAMVIARALRVYRNHKAALSDGS